MDSDIRSLIYQLIDQTISREDFERLQDLLERDDEVRQAYLKMVGLCEALSEVAAEPNALASSPSDIRRLAPRETHRSRPNWRILSSAAVVLILVGAGAFWLGRWKQPMPTAGILITEQSPDEQPESRIAGHATLRRSVDLLWPPGSVRRLEGDVLPHGLLAFDAGVAEIDFFCGATLIFEGPAVLEIESDWAVSVAKGRLRASVPPAARGFVVKAANSEIVDLGTEFALEVSSDSTRVEVIDGEVELRGGEHDGKHLATGERAALRGTSTETSLVEGLSTGTDLSRQRQVAEQSRFEQWKTDSQRMRADERLIACYPIATELNGRTVPNATVAGSRFDALLVGPVERMRGRFGADSSGLAFDRPGARVRTRIEGEFQAFTFACWAKVDSLEHRYNALFMADGYENGEPHWQIRDDGRLMFSVMVDDSQVIEHFSEIDQQVVQQAGLHRVYYTEPFWDISKSGQWFHLAAVYDPAGRQVLQFVNGEPVASEEIIDK
ncbi:MAG: FecR domain-containing protein, partial [Planctomycetaceae bacterium]|nr:FecR domain-containing protein [Planctomycetaceae bacterium]